MFLKHSWLNLSMHMTFRCSKSTHGLYKPNVEIVHQVFLYQRVCDKFQLTQSLLSSSLTFFMMYQWKVYEMPKSLRSWSTFLRNWRAYWYVQYTFLKDSLFRKSVFDAAILMTGSLHTTCGEPMSQGALNECVEKIEANECVVSRCFIMKIWVWIMNEYTILVLFLLFVVRSVWGYNLNFSLNWWQQYPTWFHA